MNELRKAAERALDALEDIFGKEKKDVGAINALRQALAQPVDAVNISAERVDETVKGEHEPVAFVNGYFGGYLTITCFDPTLVLPDGLALYTAPPKREWVGLTDEERRAIGNGFENDNGHIPSWMSFARHIEAKLKEKNGG